MNLLLVSLDTTRADRLGCYGCARVTSPHLDAFADRGTLFERCLSPHIPTHPAHTTLFTGCDVFRHRVVANGARTPLAPDVPLLAEILGGLGYRTAAADNLGHWFARGFERYEGYAWAREEDGSLRKGEAVTATALRLLADLAAGPRPFFLFAHYWDPHTPYLPPPPFHRMFYGGDERDPAQRGMEPLFAFEPFAAYFRRWLDGVTDLRYPIAQYEAAVAYMDACLAPLFHALAEYGLEADTLVAVTADHGEEMDEHAMWFDHHGLYETNVHVPLLLRGPGIPAGRRVADTVDHTDLAPSLLDLLGHADLPARLGMQGRSWAPLLSGGLREPGAPRVLTECTWMRKHALRTDEWKLIVAREHPDLHGRPPVELYHFASDPAEQRDVAPERPEVVAELRAVLDARIARRTAETGLPDPVETGEIALRGF